MELAGISMENFPPVAGNDSKTLRKLSLLEARMIGAGNESRDASLPANDSSRGSDNNSNSMSTIGFPKPRGAVGASPGRSGEESSARSNADAVNAAIADKQQQRPLQQSQQPREDSVANGKRKAPTGEAFSPPRPSPHAQSAGTPSTLSTSPGESRDWSTARPPANGIVEDSSGWKRARSGNSLPPPPPPPPPPQRTSLPRTGGERQAINGPESIGRGTVRAPHGQLRRTSSRGADVGGESPDSNANGRTGSHQLSDRSAQAQGTKPVHGNSARQGSDTLAGNGALTPPPPAANGVHNSEFSPQGTKRGGAAGAGSAVQGGATKTIQSYFFKPSNGSGVQALAASYASGEAFGGEVDLSGVDDGATPPRQGQQQTTARLSRSGSAGVGNSGNTVSSLQNRFSNATATAAAEQGGAQGHAGQQQENSPATVGGRRRIVSNGDAPAGHIQESLEGVTAKFKDAEALVKRLQKELDRANLERSGMESMADALQKQLDRKMAEFKAQEEDRETQKKQLTSVVERLLRKVSAQEASDCRAKLARDMLELGKIVSVKTGHIGRYVEAFEDGLAFKEVEQKMADMLARKSKLEARKRAVTRLLKSSSTPATGEEQSSGHARLEAVEEEETVRMHLTSLKREEVALQEEKRAFDARKVLHIRELKRVAHEDRSKFSKRPTLSGRYVLLNLLGKGGFSEVWRAFDLVQAEDVAVKVHQLLNNWTEPQKANFIRHVTREYEIHQQMRHPRIVNLTDVFEICCDSFATVLDYCRGTDLECLLRERKQLPERDARALVLQVARGLQYLNTAQGDGQERRGAIIHYDLKPGNILLDENGDVKITDFGLSKILEIKKDTERGTGGGTSMELTSKGAGTYWYLPPECFGDNPRISSKVDVWSLGVVFYQMLYGIRPFGEGLSQEKILREKVIVNANRVEFPSKPVVSEEAKSFIRSCLTYTHATRPDVHALCDLPYLTTPLSKRGA